MKPRVYVVLAVLLPPLQASLFAPLSIAGITPDLGIIVLYAIGMLTGPFEAALAGIGLGLLADLGSASFLGYTALSRGLVGLFMGILGRQVLDIASPSNILFLAAFVIGEGIFHALFIEVVHGSVPFFRLLFVHLLPNALATGVLGIVLFKAIHSRRTLEALTRRELGREV